MDWGHRVPVQVQGFGNFRDRVPDSPPAEYFKFPRRQQLQRIFVAAALHRKFPRDVAVYIQLVMRYRWHRFDQNLARTGLGDIAARAPGLQPSQDAYGRFKHQVILRYTTLQIFCQLRL